MPLLLFSFEPLLVGFSRFTDRFQTMVAVWKMSHIVSWFIKHSYRTISARQTSGDVSTLPMTLALKLVIRTSSTFLGLLFWYIPGISGNPVILPFIKTASGLWHLGVYMSEAHDAGILVSLHITCHLLWICKGRKLLWKRAFPNAKTVHGVWPRSSKTCFKLFSHWHFG